MDQKIKWETFARPPKPPQRIKNNYKNNYKNTKKGGWRERTNYPNKKLL